MHVVDAAAVRALHDAAIASLTPVQLAAVERLIEARAMASFFTPATIEARLEAACAREAAAINQAR